MSRLMAGIAVLATAPLVGCQPEGLSIEDIRSRGFLRAGYSEEPPYAFMDSVGRVTGESPEALRAAAEAVGIDDIRWVRMDFRELLPALAQGRLDVVATGLFPTPERERLVRFSRPTACSGPALVVRGEGDPPHDLADIRRDPTARLAVLDGAVEEAAVASFGVPEERVVRAPDVRTALAALVSGQADALAITAPTALYHVRQRSDDGLVVRTYDPPEDVAHLLRGCSALAFRPVDVGLARELDDALGRSLRSRERHLELGFFGFESGAAVTEPQPHGES